MKKYLNNYSKTNNEKLNYSLLKSKNDNHILDEIKTIFKSLEQIPAIHVEDIRLDTHEEEFGPIKDGKNYYKPVHGTRLQRIHYRIRIDGLENTVESDLYLYQNMHIREEAFKRFGTCGFYVKNLYDLIAPKSENKDKAKIGGLKKYGTYIRCRYS